MAFDILKVLEEQKAEQDMQNGVYALGSAVMSAEDKNIKQKNQQAVSRINTAESAGAFAPSNPTASRNKIVASLDEKGQVSITNIGTGAASQVRAAVGGSAVEKLSATNVQNRLNDVFKMDSAEAMSQAMGNINEEFTTLRLSARAEALKTAQTVLGVADIQKRVDSFRKIEAETYRQAEATGVAFIRSPQLQQAEQQLASLSALAEKKADDSIASNVQLNAINTRLQTAQTTINSTASRLDARLNREEFNSEVDAQKVEDFKLSTNPKAWSRAQRLNPNLVTDKSVMDYIVRNGNKSPADKARLMADTTELPDLFVAGDTKAESLFIEEAYNDFGVPTAESASYLKELNRLVNDKDALKKATVAAFPSEKDPTRESFSRVYNAPDLTLSKEDTAAYNASKVRAAKALINKQYENKFLGDVGSWRDPRLDNALTKLAEIKVAPNVHNALEVYVEGTTGAERISKIEEFQSILTTAANKTQGRPFGVIEGDLIKLKVVRQGLLSKLLGLTTYNNPTPTQQAEDGYLSQQTFSL